MPPVVDIVAAALIVMSGTAVQVAVGFGMGLVVVPSLLWSGRSLPEAVAVLLGVAIIQTSHGSWSLRRHIPWSKTMGLALVQWGTVPVGVLGMVALASAGPATVKQAVGGVILGILVLRIAFKPTPRDDLGWGWGVFAAGCSGLLAGLVGMGGPPIVLYALGHDWSTERFRGFLWATFLLVLPAALGALTWRFGVELLWWSALGLALTPAVWLGALGGARLSKRWSPEHLRRVATGVLVLIAVSSVIAPLLSR